MLVAFGCNAATAVRARCSVGQHIMTIRCHCSKEQRSEADAVRWRCSNRVQERTGCTFVHVARRCGCRHLICCHVTIGLMKPISLVSRQTIVLWSSAPFPTSSYDAAAEHQPVLREAQWLDAIIRLPLHQAHLPSRSDGLVLQEPADELVVAM